MSKWKDGFVESNGIQIHYYRTGNAKPQVILNHGAMDAGLCWTEIARELENDFDVIMPDARGHGCSDIGKGDYTTESRAQDLIGLIEGLELEKPVIGGHSLGADTSLYAAILRPDLISGFYMEDPPITFPGQPVFGGEMPVKPENIGKMMIRMMSLIRLVPKFLGRLIARKMMPSSPAEVIEPWLDSKKQVSKDFMSSMTDLGSMMNGISFDLLDKVKSPAMLIYGDRDSGAIVSHEVAEEMHKHIPELRVVHLAGANHDIRRARFDGYVPALKSFLKDVLGSQLD